MEGVRLVEVGGYNGLCANFICNLKEGEIQKMVTNLTLLLQMSSIHGNNRQRIVADAW